MNECPNCILYRRALIDIARDAGIAIAADAPLAQVVALAKEAVGRVVERETERTAPEWTKYELIKPRQDEDCYVLWVGTADGPAWVGTRDEALAYGITESRLRRADERGSSSRGDYGHFWDSGGMIADQVGILPRALIGQYAKAVRGGSCNPDGLNFLEPFGDAPSATVKGELGLMEKRTLARDQFTDEFDRLSMRGFVLAWVNGQRVLVTSVSEATEGMPATVTVMRF